MPRTVHLNVMLSAPPEKLYAMYLDGKQHAAFTGGGPATIAPVVGSSWSAFDGRIHGKIQALLPGRQIVQSWRSFEWREGEPDATLILTFAPAPGGASIDLVHSSVPDRLFETIEAGWATRYWEPWRTFLSGGQ
ncbi:MAG: SRPBCC domain-containing protein [Gemmatimonadota bacterium]